MVESSLEPELLVTLGLSSSLYEISAGAQDAPLQQALGDTFRRLLDRLGLPGQPAVTIEQLDSKGDPFFRLWVNGHLCRYPLRLLQRVYWYLRAEPFAPGPSANDVHQWLVDTTSTDRPIEQALLLDFFRLSCAEIVRRQAAVLLSQELVAAYAFRLPPPTDDTQLIPWPPPVDWLAPALALTLQQAISLADRETVAQVLQAAWRNESRPADTAEALINALMPDRIHILLSRKDLQGLTAVADRELFPTMRDGLFYELGMRYPAIQFAFTEELKPNAFAFEINHLTTLPWIGPQPDQTLVNAEKQTLAAHVPVADGRALRNPANDNDVTLLPSSLAADLESMNYTTWNGWGYLILALSNDLRQNSAALLPQKLVDTYIAELAAVFPALVDAFRARRNMFDLTRCLRRFLAEQVSIRDMRRILERLSDYDYIVADDGKLIIFDERLATGAEPNDDWLSDAGNLAEFTRQGMKAYISHKVTRGQSTLFVLLLAPDLEDVLRNSRVYGPDDTIGIKMDKDGEENTLHQIDEELQTHPSPLAILTTSTARSALRTLLAQVMPEVPVLSYQELSPELNPQPVARRISLA